MSWSDSDWEDEIPEESSISSFVPVGARTQHQGHFNSVGWQWAHPENAVHQQGNPGQPMNPGSIPTHVVYGRVETSMSSNSISASAENSFSGNNSRGPESKPSRRRLVNKLLYEKDVHYAKGDSSSESGSFQSQSSSCEPPWAQGLAPPQAGPSSSSRAQHQPPASSSQQWQPTPAGQPQQAQGERRKPKLAAEQPAPEACDVPPDVLAQIPYDEDGQRTTVGSIKHATGNCRPCAFLYTNVGCNKGIACTGCHIPHRRKDRPRLGRRERMKDMMASKAASSTQNGREAVDGQ